MSPAKFVLIQPRRLLCNLVSGQTNRTGSEPSNPLYLITGFDSHRIILYFWNSYNFSSMSSLPKAKLLSQNPSIEVRFNSHKSIGVGRKLLFLRPKTPLFGKVKVCWCSHQTEALVDSSIPQSDVPVLSCIEVIERLNTFRENYTGKLQFLAMYSSIVGGITTDPAAMVIPVDDHMVHRGHGVFDTAAIMDGHLYELDQHIDRILRSAAMAKINLPFDRESIRSILIKTVSVSQCRKGSLRYWLSVGPGDFQLSPSGCGCPALYAIVIQDQSPFNAEGVRVVTSSVPIKPHQFAIMKSVNYLPNALSKMEAEENGAFAAIWLDNDGFIAEGPNMNVAFVTKEKELLMPRFDKILSGCTARRVLALAEGLVMEGKLCRISVQDVTVEEGKGADEMMLIGSGILVRPVLQWDDQVIGNGKEGPITQELLKLIVEDMKFGPPVVRLPVPY